MEVQRRVCFIMNNPRGRFTSAATHKPSHFRVEMSEIMKIPKKRRNNSLFLKRSPFIILNQAKIPKFQRRKHKWFFTAAQRGKNLDIKRLFSRLFVAIITNRVIASRQHAERRRERMKCLDYVKIEDDELGGSIYLLSGLLRIIKGLQAHIFSNIHI